MTLALAWRNLWRRRRRTAMTVAAMAFCNTMLVALVSLQFGTYRMMIDNALALSLGHFQLQHEDFLAQGGLRDSVPAAAPLARRLRDEPAVEAVAARAHASALGASEDRTLGLRLDGVQPRYEGGVSALPGLVAEGRYLAGDGAAEIVLGRRLADRLRLGPGDELILLGTGHDGSFAAGVVKVVGIVATDFAEVDRSLAQVPLAWLQATFALGDKGHAVVGRVREPERLAATLVELEHALTLRPPLRLRDWNTLRPGLRQAIRSDIASAAFLYLILVLLVALGVLSTQLMSVLERTREFGVLLALGLGPWQLVRLVFAETALLGALGFALGLLCGGALAAWFSLHGVVFPGMDELAARFNLPGRMYPEFSLRALATGPAAVFFAALLAAIYPCWHLLRLHPVTAMRAA